MEYGRILELIEFGKNNDLSLIEDNETYLIEIISQSLDNKTITHEQAKSLDIKANLNFFSI